MPLRDVTGVIGRHLDLPVARITAAEKDGHFGFFSHFASADSPTSSELTRKLLGWEPVRPGLIPDLEGHYLTG